MIVITGQCLVDNQYVIGDGTIVYFFPKVKWIVIKATLVLNEVIYLCRKAGWISGWCGINKQNAVDWPVSAN